MVGFGMARFGADGRGTGREAGMVWYGLVWSGMEGLGSLRWGFAQQPLNDGGLLPGVRNRKHGVTLCVPIGYIPRR